MYTTLELDADGVFRSMLLRKKKKYAAVTITTDQDGQYVMGRERRRRELNSSDVTGESNRRNRVCISSIRSCQVLRKRS